ncbi:GNAT family N-acetyltransferase [Pseudomonas sp. NA-150]|uniref:GNAT family N-acetyltransferase n=1 Tax=Pseudomonas sp. NA-150 TaxID=3367525 RepID=UPI0037CCBE7F
MDVQLRQATAADLDFARELTRVNMRPYYAQYARIWQAQSFDDEWGVRQSFIINKVDKPIGFLSISLEARYLYLRDVQLCEPYRGEGVGGWVMQQIMTMAQARGARRIRLKVFKSNPAMQLYQRQGFTVVREERASYWMERQVLA